MKIFGWEIKRNEQNLTQNNAKSLRKQIAYEQELMRTRQDIARLRKATIYAESKTNPNRVELLRVYKDTMLDAQVSACIMQRKNAILCRDWMIIEGEEEDEKQKTLLDKEWFDKFVSLALDSIYYGFTLIDFGPMVDDNFNDIQEVPREYVCPEFMVVSQYQGGCSGVSIEDPRYKPWNMFVGDRCDLGLLMKASYYAIWKKNALGAWSEYNEKFGVPMRIGKVSTTDQKQIDNMEGALKSAGQSFYAIIDHNDEINFLDSEKSGAYEIFDKNVERMNSEISKLILGQTGTTDEKSFVGSAQVHYDVRRDIIESDAISIENLVNDKLIPWLNQYHGYNITGEFEYNFSESMGMQEKAALVTSMMPHVKFDTEWLEREFNIEIDDTVEEEPSSEDAAAKKSLTSYENIISSYNFTCTKCGGEKFFEVVNLNEDTKTLVLQSIWLGNTS